MEASAAGVAGLAYGNTFLTAAVIQNPKAAAVAIIKQFASAVKMYRSEHGYWSDWQGSSWDELTFQDALKHGETKIQNCMRFVAAELKAVQELAAIRSLPDGPKALDDSIGRFVQMGCEMEDRASIARNHLEQLQPDDARNEAKNHSIIKIWTRSVIQIAENYRDTLLKPFGFGKTEAEEIGYITMSHLSWRDTKDCSEAHTQWLGRYAEGLAKRLLHEGERHKIPEQELKPVLEHMCNYMLSEARIHLMSVSPEFAQNIVSTMKERFDHGIKNILRSRQSQKETKQKEGDETNSASKEEKNPASTKIRYSSDGVTAMLDNIEAAKTHPFAQRVQERPSLENTKTR